MNTKLKERLKLALKIIVTINRISNKWFVTTDDKFFKLSKEQVDTLTIRFLGNEKEIEKEHWNIVRVMLSAIFRDHISQDKYCIYSYMSTSVETILMSCNTIEEALSALEKEHSLKRAAAYRDAIGFFLLPLEIINESLDVNIKKQT